MSILLLQRAAMPQKRKYQRGGPEELIAGRLRELRKRAGKTQVQLAKELGMHQSVLSRYERGELRVHGSLVATFAKTLKARPDEILGFKPIKGGNGVVNDHRFVRRLQLIGKLSKRDKEVLLRSIDTFLKGAGVS